MYVKRRVHEVLDKDNRIEHFVNAEDMSEIKRRKNNERYKDSWLHGEPTVALLTRARK